VPGGTARRAFLICLGVAGLLYGTGVGYLALAAAIAIHLSAVPRWTLIGGYAGTIVCIARFAAPLGVDRATGSLRPGDTVLVNTAMSSGLGLSRGELIVFNSPLGTRIAAPWPFRGDILFPSRQVGQVISVAGDKVRVMPGAVEISTNDIVGVPYWRCQPLWRWGVIR
jgi:hypothetical protein